MKPFDLLANAVRAKEIAAVLARHGFADLLEQLDLPAGIRHRLSSEPGPPKTAYERIRLALEDLGPTFVKFGQFLSMRPDVLPHGLILELSKLRDAVQPVPFSEMGPLLRAELGVERNAVFGEFDEAPVASGSLAQVYFARLKRDGRAVAVKLQRPAAARIIQTDLGFAAWLAAQVHQRSAQLQPYDLPAVIEEMRQSVLRELDFRNEARHLQYFNSGNPYADKVFAPAVVEDLTTERMLIMERVNGTPIGRAELSPERARELAASGARSLVHQVLVAGFFHADPHGGNILVADDGRLCLLDWGMAGHLTRRLRLALADFWDAVEQQEAERIAHLAALLAPTDARPHLRVMEKEITLVLREELNFVAGKPPQLGRAMLKLLFIFGRQGIPLAQDYSLMAKSVLSIEQVGVALDPAFDLRIHIQPVLRALDRERINPRTLWRHARDFLRASFAGLEELPGQVQRLVRRFEHDNITFTMQHRGLDRLEQALQTASNRIALGVIIGSLIIGSSMIVTIRIPPYLFGYPVLGIVGFVISALLGLYVIWDIIRHGRHR